ncbi:ADP-ribosylation_factor [Hexamita inflata]|uniref:ADP-ribosylation factor n=1 Tax=Hexamita inflata TaxID=28002 RepID=A0AA86TCL1_9EUKA|nr:ADP-ribosylation factor [Hexamita inflata]CAI9913946.1 ADP-ribosylation factor [Hexamita inflata]
MGSCCSFKTDLRVLLRGLDASGKTSILYKLFLNEIVNTIPTIGFNVETFKHKRHRVTFWDLGGSTHLRQLWFRYYQNTDFIIYVIDSSETAQYRINEVKEEIHEISNNNLIKDLPLVILANKSDIQKLSTEEIIDLYNLDSINQVCKIFSTSIYDRESILSVVDWICTV